MTEGAVGFSSLSPRAFTGEMMIQSWLNEASLLLLINCSLIRCCCVVVVAFVVAVVVDRASCDGCAAELKLRGRKVRVWKRTLKSR